VLPTVLYESHLKTFKFWFADAVQDGTHHNNELFCRLVTYDLSDRGPAYQLGCRLGQQGYMLLLTVTPTDCSLWGGLREPITHAVLTGAMELELTGSVLPTIVTPVPNDE